MQWFRSERRQWRTDIRRANLQSHPTLGLPRAVLLPRLQPDRERMNFWMSPAELLRHRYVPGQITLGKFAEQFFGHMDDRPTIRSPNKFSASQLNSDKTADAVRRGRIRSKFSRDNIVAIWTGGVKRLCAAADVEVGRFQRNPNPTRQLLKAVRSVEDRGSAADTR